MFRFVRSNARRRGAARFAGSAGWRCWQVALGWACVAMSCTEDVRLGVDQPGQAAAAGAAGAGSAGSGPLFPSAGAAGVGGAVVPPGVLPVDAGVCVPTPCGAQLRQCGDCEDNDMDGRSDATDPECLGPCDDSESELSTGIPTRVNGSCRADCYFDLNAGSGDDGCGWSFRCDPLSLEPDYPPTGSPTCGYDPAAASCDPSPAEVSACQAGCLPLTPNGCDCFGCCELPAGSGRFAWLGSESLEDPQCALASSGDATSCKPCTPAPSCNNPCDGCELCVGKPELPAACGGARVPACREGVRACDPLTSLGCLRGEYCITGCCVPSPR